VVQVASVMAQRPERSLPKQTQSWGELKGAYRFLSNPRVEPAWIGRAHQQLTREACLAQAVVLCVQDDSDLCAVKIDAEQYMMHSTLAVLPSGEVLGLLQQRFFARVEQPDRETRKQRAGRWRESDVWQEAVEEIGDSPSPCRFIHVADRGADNLRFMHACVNRNVGFVVRAHHDRRVNEGAGKLWAHLVDQPIAGTTVARIGTQRNGLGRIVRQGRDATLAVRLARVRLEEPSNGHEQHDGPLTVNVIYLREIDPPAGVEPVDWMLLTSEPATTFEQALVIIGYYRCRWVIEEWHRALKEGCRLEGSQLQDAQALLRLTAVLSVVAIRLIQLRDLADTTLADTTRQDPKALQGLVPPTWILIVATLAKADPATLTPRQFWRLIARRGGWLARKSDPRPGWKAIWTGWHDVQQLVEGAELIASSNKLTLTGCG
jgi:hypothetical protein